jgi:hypothetical protein
LAVTATAAWLEGDDAHTLTGTVGSASVTGALAWTEDDDQWALAATVPISAPVATMPMGGGGTIFDKWNDRRRRELDLAREEELMTPLIAAILGSGLLD